MFWVSIAPVPLMVRPLPASFTEWRLIRHPIKLRVPGNLPYGNLGEAESGAAKGQHCLDGTPAFVLSLFQTFRGERSLSGPAEHAASLAGIASSWRARAGKYRSYFFLLQSPRNPLISPDSGKWKETEGNRRKGKG